MFMSGNAVIGQGIDITIESQEHRISEDYNSGDGHVVFIFAQ